MKSIQKLIQEGVNQLYSKAYHDILQRTEESDDYARDLVDTDLKQAVQHLLEYKRLVRISIGKSLRIEEPQILPSTQKQKLEMQPSQVLNTSLANPPMNIGRPPQPAPAGQQLFKQNPFESIFRIPPPEPNIFFQSPFSKSKESLNLFDEINDNSYSHRDNHHTNKEKRKERPCQEAPTVVKDKPAFQPPTATFVNPLSTEAIPFNPFSKAQHSRQEEANVIQPTVWQVPTNPFLNTSNVTVKHVKGLSGTHEQKPTSPIQLSPVKESNQAPSLQKIVEAEAEAKESKQPSKQPLEKSSEQAFQLVQSFSEISHNLEDTDLQSDFSVTESEIFSGDTDVASHQSHPLEHNADDLKDQQAQKVGQYLLTNLTSGRATQFQNTCSTYYPSNYFHVGPRYSMLNFLGAIIQAVDNSKKAIFDYAMLKNQSLIDAGKTVTRLVENSRGAIASTIAQYSSSNYFHVGPRRHMFGVVEELIRASNQLRAKVGPLNL